MELRILGLVGILAVAMLAGAWAVVGEPWNPENIREKPDEGTRDQIMQAIEDGDYETWSQLVEGRPITEYINEENFEQFAEMHEHMREAKQIQEDLGLPRRGRHRKGRINIVQNCNCGE